jgi:HAD superfamily hydrolase (TIGR01509 family)
VTTVRLPDAVLFDWDGTLVDTMSMIYRANVIALRSYGISMSREWFRERYTPDWRQSYRELGIPEHLWGEMAGRWTDEMVKMRPRALPWARSALRRLRSRGIRVGLVTASTRAVVEPSIARLNLAGVFETAFYSDDVARSKPHPEALLRAMDELGVAPAATIYVGDTPVDLEMTRAAGASFAAVGTTTPEEVFRAAGVDRVWSGVGAWTDDLLGPGGGARAIGRRDPRTGPSGTVVDPGAGDSIAG